MRRGLALAIISTMVGFKSHGQAKQVEAVSEQKPIAALSQILPVIDLQHLVAGYVNNWDELQTIETPHTVAHEAHLVNDLLIRNAQKVVEISPDFSQNTERVIEIFQRINNRFELIQTLQPFSEEFTPCIAHSHNGKFLAAAAVTQGVKIWQFVDNKFIKFQELDRNNDPLGSAVAFSSDGKYLAIGLFNGPIKIWELINNKFTCVQALPNENDSLISSMIFTHDDTLISGSEKGIIKIWKHGKDGFACMQNINAHANGHITKIIFSKKAQYVLTLAMAQVQGQKDKVWELQDNKLAYKETLEKITGIFISGYPPVVALSSNANHIAFQVNEQPLKPGPIKILQYSEAVLTSLGEFASDFQLQFAHFSPQGEYLIYGDTKKLKVVYNLAQALLLDKKKKEAITINQS